MAMNSPSGPGTVAFRDTVVRACYWTDERIAVAKYDTAPSSRPGLVRLPRREMPPIQRLASFGTGIAPIS
jgi:hypothetical protein